MIKPYKNKSGIYYARKMVPKPLRHKLGPEMKRSLQTRDRSVADRRIFSVSLEFDSILEGAEQRDEFLTPLRMSQIVGQWLHASLGKDHASRLEGNPEESFKSSDESTQTTEGGDPDSVGLLPYDMFIEELQDSRHHNDLSSLLTKEAKPLLEDNGFFLRELSSEVSRGFLEELFYGKMRYYTTLNERYLGRYIQVDQSVYPLEPSPPSPAHKKSPQANALLDSWSSEREPSRKSEDSMRVSITRLTTIIGNLQAHEIARTHIREYKEGLQKIKTNKGTTLSVGSVNKSITAVGTLLAFGEQQGYFDGLPWSNPTTGMRIVSKNLDALRLPFTNEEASRIVEGAPGDLIPKIAYYTGARLGEIVQLTKGDIVNVDGIYVFDFNAKDNKRIKNRASIRRVPVHSEILQEVLSLTRIAEKDLFNTDSGTYSKKFMTSLRGKLSIHEPRKVFHSFRHTMKDNLRNVGVELVLQNAILGHTTKGVGESYGRGYTVKTLKESIEKIKPLYTP
jgi:integrase